MDADDGVLLGVEGWQLATDVVGEGGHGDQELFHGERKANIAVPLGPVHRTRREDGAGTGYGGTEKPELWGLPFLLFKEPTPSRSDNPDITPCRYPPPVSSSPGTSPLMRLCRRDAGITAPPPMIPGTYTA